MENIVCGVEFTVDAGEQAFFWDHELAPPKRCVMCRKWRRLDRREHTVENTGRI